MYPVSRFTQQSGPSSRAASSTYGLDPLPDTRSARGNQATPQSRNAVVNGVRETRLVIGVDFGTTYTGVAYATPLGTVCPLEEITVRKIWGQGMNAQDKVPSVISYDKSNGDYQQWGSSIDPNSIVLIHKKLELCLHPLQGELDLAVQLLDKMKDLHFENILLEKADGKIPEFACKSPEEIICDFLTKIFTYLDREVNKFSDAFRSLTTTDLVITVPTGWPYEALNSTYRAVTKAGFNRVNFPKLNDVLFITESEAAARYTVRYYKEQEAVNFLHDNSYFVLCDAGGGTVDVVSYKVVKTAPTLQLLEIGKPSGAKCGSIFINKKFKQWLRRKIGDDNYCELDPDLNIDKAASNASETGPMRELMKEFDIRKEQFTAFGTQDIHISLPEPLHNLSIPGVVQGGEITITREKMESFFDACLNRVLSLIERHMKQIEKNLFLVGGFGSSDYLKHYIEDTMKDYRVRFRTPDTSWTAIVQGAVVCGIDKAQIPSIRKAKACTRSYGVTMDEIFRETNHTEDDLTQERDGKWYAKAQLIWLLDQGDVIFEDKPCIVKKAFDISFSKNQSQIDLPIYQHSLLDDEVEADRPDRYNVAKNVVFQAAVLRIDLIQLRGYVEGKYGDVRSVRESLYQGIKTMQSRTTGNVPLKAIEGAFFSTLKTRYSVTLDLKLELSWDSLQVSVSWRGHELNRVTA
ncbi:hypothetical protein GQ44DRAFT_766352 [Phaeosphaeriaceae sp. PMI808]|nr:hypothetical protein GQ44DRAFT_766352 [Phaeosphaeriaceae sp. PMI808]